MSGAVLALEGWPGLLLAGLFGAAGGSFAGLASRRMPRGGAVVLARSACEGCGRRLGVADLAPVAGYVAALGRCRSCKAPIARRYLFLELGCGLGAALGAAVHPGIVGLTGVVLLVLLVLLALLDAEHYWLPRAVTLPLIGSGIAASSLAGWRGALDSLVGAAAGFATLWAIAFAYRKLRGREGLGGGDAYMLAGAGAWVGWIGLPTVLLWSSLAGLSLVFAGVLCGNRLDMTKPLPFGTFLALGAWLTWLFGPFGLSA